MKNHQGIFKRFLLRTRLAVILSFGFLTTAAQLLTTSKITVDLSRPGHAISPWLYNRMSFDEIGLGADGGFYAQMVSNNTFEDNIPESGWTTVYHGSSYDTSYSLMTSETKKLNKSENHCIRLDIKSGASGGAGIANGGFWGLRLDNNAKYKVYFFAGKDPNFKGVLTVKLESNSGEVDASSDSIVPTTDWKKYSFDLITSRPGEIVQHWHYQNSQQFDRMKCCRCAKTRGPEPIYCTSKSIDDFFVDVPIENIQPFVQDCLNQIEYANENGNSTYWGRNLQSMVIPIHTI